MKNKLQVVFEDALVDIENDKLHLLIVFDHLINDNYQKKLVDILKYLTVPYKMVFEESMTHDCIFYIERFI